MPGSLRPLSADLQVSRELGRKGIAARTGGVADPAQLQGFEERLGAGGVHGRLYFEGGRPAALACWPPAGLRGLALDLLCADDRATLDPELYLRVLAAIEDEVGPIVIVPGPLVGVEPSVEERMMRSRGYRRFGRSEMVLGRSSETAEPPGVPADRLRRAERSDLTGLGELHAKSYHGQFDRYLFAEVEDEREDGRRGMQELFDGRWGEFSPAGSWVVEREGHLVGAVISVRGRQGTLIADVMVDPASQGRGLGRRVLSRAIASLHAEGEQRIYLNVTEGNGPAERLYTSLGFARSLGPTRDWYHAGRIPNAPGEGPGPVSRPGPPSAPSSRRAG